MFPLLMRMLLAGLWHLPPGEWHAAFDLRVSGLRLPPIHCQGTYSLDNRAGIENLRWHVQHHCRPDLEEEEHLQGNLIWRLDQGKVYELDTRHQSYRLRVAEVPALLAAIQQPGKTQPYFDGSTLSLTTAAEPWLWRLQPEENRPVTDVLSFAQGYACHLSLYYDTAKAESFLPAAGWREESEN